MPQVSDEKDIRLYSTINTAKISKILKVSKCTVQKVIFKKKIETGNIKNRKKSGKSTKLTKMIVNI